MPTYDYTDLLIRTMVDLHRPIETRVTVEGQAGMSITVDCDHCVSTWPCSAVTGLRAWRVANPGV